LKKQEVQKTQGVELNIELNNGAAKPERFDHDDFYKSLIKRFFWYFLEMALPELYADADINGAYEFLDKEFSDILNTGDSEIHESPHFADYVIKVPMKNGGEKWLILHLEIQGKGGETLSVRMYHYKCLIYAHYKKEPVALVVITDKRPTGEASGYAHSHYGTKTIYEYNNLVIMDLDDDALLSSDNPIALVLYAAKSALKVKEEFQKYKFLHTLAGLLAGRGWSMMDKRDILLFIERIVNLKDKALKRQYWEYRQKLSEEGKVMWKHWLDEVVEEEIEQRGIALGMAKGVAKGVAQGREEGMEKAREEMARNLLANGVSPEIIAKSGYMPVEQVRALIS